MSQPAIQSGWFTAPSGSSLTPTGAAKRSEKDNPYITKDEYIQSPEAVGSGISAISADNFYTSGALDKAILRASSWVNRHCSRWFDVQTIDETRTGFTVKPFNPRLVSVYTRNSPIQDISGIWIQVLKFFIQVQTTPIQDSYLQIFPDIGIFKIVPLLSSAGSGTGSPIPAQILDKVPLGVLWYSYTFGFGQIITGYTLEAVTTNTVYQVADFNYKLWAPDQTLNVYVDATLQASTLYTVDFANGVITFLSDIGTGHTVTADFTTNNTVPADVKYATILLTTKYLLSGQQNPMKFKNINITGYGVSFGEHDDVMREIKEMLAPYRKSTMTLI